VPDPDATRARGPARGGLRFGEVTSRDGTLIETWTNGADGPTVLLCNGLGGNPYTWPALLDAACGLHVVSWSHRGTRGSRRPEDPDRVGIEAFVEDALAVLDAEGIAGCVVAGWSLGVNTAFELALRHPERVSGLFALCGVPGGSFASMGGPLPLPRSLREPVSTGVARLLQRVGPILGTSSARLLASPQAIGLLRRSGLMAPTAPARDVRRAVEEFLRTPLDWYLHLAVAASTHRRVPPSAITVPTTFVAGDRDLLASSADLRAAAEAITGASYVELRGTHYLSLERSDEVTALLRDLAARTDADEVAA